MRRDWLLYIAILIFCGAAWGITQPLAKIAVTAGYRHFGIIFWQFAIGAALLGAINAGLGDARRAEEQFEACRDGALSVQDKVMAAKAHAGLAELALS